MIPDLIIFLCLLGYCLALTRFCNIAIEITPFFTLSCLISLLFFCGLLGVLAVAAPALILIGGLLLIGSAFYLPHDRTLLLQRFCTPGLILLLIAMLGLAITAHYCHLTQWDEFTHWGPEAKLIFMNHGFVTAKNLIQHKGYPPGADLFYYLFYQLGGYSEGSSYFAQTLLLIAPLGVLLRNISWRNAMTGALILALALIVLLSFHTGIWPKQPKLYIDSAIGIYFAMCVMQYRNTANNCRHILLLAPALFTLMLFKAHLLGFGMMVITIIFADQWLQQKKFPPFKYVLSILALLITCLIATKSWQLYLHHIHQITPWKTHYTSLSAMQHLFTAATTKNIVIIQRFLHKMLKLSPTIFAILILNSVTLWLTKDSLQRRRLLLTQLLLLSFLIFSWQLLLMYLFNFSYFEALNLASFHRYMNIILLVWGLISYAEFALYWRCRHIQQRLATQLFILTLIGFAIIGYIAHHKYQMKHQQHRTTQQLQSAIRTIAAAVKQHARANDKVFSVWQYSMGFPQGILIYELFPRVTNSCSSFGKPFNQHDVWTCKYSKKQFLQALTGYQYLLLAYTGPTFWQHYGSLFSAPKNHIKPLVTYTTCRLKNTFNAVNQKGCVLVRNKAYLFKIQRHHGRIIFDAIST